MARKTTIIVLVLSLIFVIWVGYTINKNQTITTQFTETSHQLELQVNTIGKTLSEENPNSATLLSQTREAKSTALLLQSIIENNTNQDTHIEEKQKIIALLSGLDLIERAILEKDQESLDQAMLIFESL